MEATAAAFGDEADATVAENGGWCSWKRRRSFPTLKQLAAEAVVQKEWGQNCRLTGSTKNVVTRQVGAVKETKPILWREETFATLHDQFVQRLKLYDPCRVVVHWSAKDGALTSVDLRAALGQHGRICGITVNKKRGFAVVLFLASFNAEAAAKAAAPPTSGWRLRRRQCDGSVAAKAAFPPPPRRRSARYFASSSLSLSLRFFALFP